MHPSFFTGTPYEISSWSFCLLLGIFVVAIPYFLWRPRDFVLEPINFTILYIVVIIFGLFGANIGFAILQMIKHPLYGPNINMSGENLLGALFSEMLAMLLVAKARPHPVSFLKIADYGMAFLYLHLAFVRMGCFLRGCCYGKVTNMPWKCVFIYGDPLPRHPTQIYLLLGALAAFYAGRQLYKHRHVTGVPFFAALAVHSFIRLNIEFFRAGSVKIAGNLMLPHLFLAGIFTVSILSLCILMKRVPE